MSDEKQSKSAVAQLVVLTAIVIGLFLAMRFLPIQQWLRSFNDWVGHMGAAGIFVFILVYAVATVLMAPGSILTIGAGFAFGLWKGFLAVSAKRLQDETKSFARSTMRSANKARS